MVAAASRGGRVEMVAETRCNVLSSARAGTRSASRSASTRIRCVAACSHRELISADALRHLVRAHASTRRVARHTIKDRQRLDQRAAGATDQRRFFERHRGGKRRVRALSAAGRTRHRRERVRDRIRAARLAPSGSVITRTQSSRLARARRLPHRLSAALSYQVIVRPVLRSQDRVRPAHLKSARK